MKYLLTSIFLLVPLWSALAQTTVRGTVVDSTGSTLPGASVVLLQKSDSVLHSFSISDNKGNFSFKKVSNGKYIIQVSYLGYNNFSVEQNINTDQEEFDLGKVTLDENSKMLDGVSIMADRVPIVIKEDTIEYNAASFKTKPNASVEELLKKLPGIEVENDGTIKAQGETVNKVLVDGKEFFGNDPKLATRNLSSDAVDKVQVFDKMSEMTEFTGIDDGDRDKTINLTLKEDKKKGVFGKLTGSYGTDERHTAKVGINKFNKTTQLSFLGSTNNINQQDFSIQDYINLNGGLSQFSGGGGSLRISSAELGGNFSTGNRTGINTTKSAGINYNHDFKDKSELSINYFFSGLEQNLERESIRDNFINGQTFSSTNNSSITTANYNHRLNMRLKKALNNQADITFKSTLALTDSEENNQEEGDSFNPAGLLQNQSIQFNNADNKNYNFRGSTLYRRRFAKKGRAFTAQLETEVNNSDGIQQVNSNNQFYANGSLSEEISISQNQNQLSDQTDYKTVLTYAEPIGHKNYIQFNYTRQNFDTDLEKDFFDLLPDLSENFNVELSTRYRRDYHYDRGGIKLLANLKKSSLNLGVNTQNSRLKGTLTDESIVIKRDFFNVLPSLRWQIDFAQSKNLTLNYYTSVNEPSLRQLQPFVDNSDPLRVYIGNPDLKVEYRHNIQLNYLLFDNFSFTSLFLTFGATITSNKITNETEIDQFLRQTIRPVNIGEEIIASGYVSFSTPVKKLGMKVNLNINNNAVKSQLFVNGLENDLFRWINTFDIKIENRKKEILDASIGIRLTLNDTQYSNNTELDQNFVNRTLYGSLGISIGEKWNLSTSLDYQTYSSDAFNDNQDIAIWKAEFSRNFLKFNRGQLKLSAFDLLNQNRGINRNSNFNYIEDERYNALERYFMVSFTYSLR